MSESLATYLNDHLGGAQVATHLLETMRTHHPDSHYRQFAGQLLPHIQEDDGALRDVISAIGSQPSTIKDAGGWLLEKMARIKLGHTSSHGLEMFESLEILTLGIFGKERLWAAMDLLSLKDGRLRSFDFGRLQERARAQLSIVEDERLLLIQRVFAA